MQWSIGKCMLEYYRPTSHLQLLCIHGVELPRSQVLERARLYRKRQLPETELDMRYLGPGSPAGFSMQLWSRAPVTPITLGSYTRLKECRIIIVVWYTVGTTRVVPSNWLSDIPHKEAALEAQALAKGITELVYEQAHENNDTAKHLYKCKCDSFVIQKNNYNYYDLNEQ